MGVLDAMTRSLATALLAFALSVVAAGCGSSFEEACTDYCEALADSGCENVPDSGDCEEQCLDAKQQLDGKCEEEYTETLDCAADEEITCEDGNPQLTSANCAEEAFELLACLDEEGVLDGDSTTEESGGTGD